MAGTAGPRVQVTELTAGRVARARAPMAGPRTGSPRPRPSPGLRPRSPGCAHKDPDLRNTHRTQGLDSALVCDAVLPNSGPCVRCREGRAVTGHVPRPAGAEGGVCADARYWRRRALFAPARVISPSQCQRPPRGVNDSLAMSTTPSRCQRPLAMPTTRVGAPRRLRTPALPGARRRRPRRPLLATGSSGSHFRIRRAC